MSTRHVQCPKCSRKFQVRSLPTEIKVKCPACEKVLNVPPAKAATGQLADKHPPTTSATGSAVHASKPVNTGWQLRTFDGEVFGPYTPLEVKQYIAELRIVADSELMHAELTGGTWKAAKNVVVFSSLFDQQPPPPAPPPPPPSARPSVTVQAETKSQPAPIASTASQQASFFSQFAWKSPWTRPKIVAYVIAGFSAFVLLFFGVSGTFSFLMMGTELNPNSAGIGTYLFGPFMLMFFLTFAFVVYGMPTIVAFLRYHRNVVPILVINVCFGWTVLGWVLSLAWAFASSTRSDSQSPQIHTHIYNHPPSSEPS